MKYIIDDELTQKLGLTIPQIFTLLAIKTSSPDLRWTICELIEMKAVINKNGKDFVTNEWSDVCDKILKTSEKYIPTDKELEPIALELISIFPQGKKPGTPYYWKSNKRDVISKLKSFFKLYGNTYSEEQIINAARRYVASYNGDYRFMRLLKYFIWKKEDGIESSDLATFIDNEDQDDQDGEDHRDGDSGQEPNLRICY